ncbi:hypothetical protein BH23PAT1_BH23PAT1_3390 [soil metagenome]
MAQTVSRQDMQGVVEYAKNSIIERMVSKGNLQTMAEQLRNSILRNLNELHDENQQLFRQSQVRRDQLYNKVITMEAQIAQTNNLLQRVLEQQAKILTTVSRY